MTGFGQLIDLETLSGPKRSGLAAPDHLTPHPSQPTVATFCGEKLYAVGRDAPRKPHPFFTRRPSRIWARLGSLTYSLTCIFGRIWSLPVMLSTSVSLPFASRISINVFKLD